MLTGVIGRFPAPLTSLPTQDRYPPNVRWAPSKIFGVVSYSPAVTTHTTFDEVEDTLLKYVSELEKNNLYTEIENACLNYNRGKDEFYAATANYEFNKKSFSTVEKKFEAGLVDVTDYSAAKSTLFSAETEALRTKLQLLVYHEP